MSQSYRKDLTGQRFGRLTVLEFVPTEDKYSHWKCRCACGNQKIVNSHSLTTGGTKSCGCLAVENSIIQGSKNNRIHAKSKTNIYKVWQGMKRRCYNKHNEYYKNYGGRGITVCAEWRDDFAVFEDWAMENGYRQGLSIDRIDNDKGYSPSNCRWVDRKTQARNRRITITVKYKGKTMSLAEASQKLRINYVTLKERYYRGDRGKRLFRPVDKSKRHKNK